MKTIAIASLALFALSAGLGSWLGIARTPYHVVLLAAHKLTSVALAVLCVIFFINSARETGMTARDTLSVAALAASLVLLLATGAVMSGKPQPDVLLKILHAASTGVLLFSAGWKLIAYLIG